MPNLRLNPIGGVMKKDCGIIGAFAACRDCGKVFESYKNAQALAAQHAKKYGHTVSGESTLHFTYTGTTTQTPKGE